MLQLRDIYKNPGIVKQELKQRISSENIDFLIDTISKLLDEHKQLQEMNIKLLKKHEEMYRKLYNIPKDAIIDRKI